MHPVFQRVSVRALLPLWAAAALVGGGLGRSWAEVGVASLRLDYSIKVFDTEDGLPEFALASVACTPDGYLWFSTFSGVGRFDGARFERLTLPGTAPEAPARTRKVFVDRKGQLWVGAAGQILRLDPSGWRNFGPAAGVLPTVIHEFADTPQGDLWAASVTDILRLRGERFEVVTPRAGLGDERTSLAVETNGTVWCAGGDYLGRWAGDHWETALSAPTTLTNRIRGLLRARGGGLWVAGEQDIRLLAGGEWTKRWPRVAGHIGDAVQMLEDDRGNLWMGGWRTGLLVFGPDGQVREATAKDGLANPSVADLTQDLEGNIWVASNGGGLMRLRPQAFRQYGHQAGLAQIVNSVCEESPGRMVVGTHGDGVAVLENGQFIWPNIWAESNFIAGIWVHSVLRDQAGDVWAGSFSPGLLWLHDGAWERVPNESTGARIINALFEDRAGRLWVGTAAGLAVREHSMFSVVKPESGLPHMVVRGLAEDREGALWVCGPGYGLFRRTAGKFVRFTVPGVAPNADFMTLVGGKDGTIWVGISDQGVARIQGERCFFYRPQHGLPFVGVASMAEDNEGNIWLGTTLGVSKLTRHSLDLVAGGSGALLECQGFDKADGLPGIPRGGFQPAVCKASDGRLWFATLRGVAVVDPARLPRRLPPPLVEIREVRLDGQAVTNWHRPLRSFSFFSGERHLDIDYAAIRLGTPDRVLYRRRLQASDPWEAATRVRSTHLHALRPGRYQFEVQAADIDGVWGPSAFLEYVVRPHFWQTGWFIALVAVTAGTVGWIAYRRRLAVLTELQQAHQTFARRLMDREEQWRHKTAVDLHDSLGQLLQVIRNRATMALNSKLPPAGNEHVAAISEAAESAVGEARNIVRSLRPHYLEQLGLTRSLHYLVTQISQASPIQWARSIDPIDSLLPAELHIHLFRIVQECLTNVTRHSGATSAGLVVARGEAALVIEIWDNGQGLAAKAGPGAPDSPTGLGLRSIQERVHLLGGECRLQPAAQGGLCVTVRIPIAQPPP